MDDTKVLLEKYRITPDLTKDQFFLWDPMISQRIAEAADLNKDDVVLEIGAGTGNLTYELAKKAGKVISFEIDKRFTPLLKNLPINVELRMEDAWDYVQLHGKYWHHKQYNKIVSNLPYSFAEKFLHNLTFLRYDQAILLIPKSLAVRIKNHPIFSSFFEVVKLFEVSSDKFYPQPKTKSVVVSLVKLPDVIKLANLALFLRQFIYQYEDNKVKNSLREGLIKYFWLQDCIKLTKNQAREIIKQSGIDQKLLETPPEDAKIYEQISERFTKIKI
ncbi:hypothetical protein M1563_02960 [Patescibacteria group bacterium]|nr:hypothetical protein [Patescibacteria group bacterium]